MIGISVLSAVLAVHAAAFPRPSPALTQLIQVAGPGAVTDATPPPPTANPVAAPAPLPSWPTLISRSYWDAASPLSAETSAWLPARVPDVPPAAIRELSFPAIAAIIDEAVRLGETNIDMFTDEGLRGDVAYFLSADTLAKIFSTYDLNSSLYYSGTSSAGQPFRMQGIVMGRGQFNVLYDQDKFDFYNAEDDYTYRCASRVQHGIEGPGQMSIQGLWAIVAKLKIRISRSEKISPTTIRVETTAGSVDHAVKPVRRR